MGDPSPGLKPPGHSRLRWADAQPGRPRDPRRLVPRRVLVVAARGGSGTSQRRRREWDRGRRRGPATGPIAGTVTRYTVGFDVDSAAAHTTLDVDVAAPGGDCFQVGDRGASTGFLWNGAPAASAAITAGVLDACGTHVSGPDALKLTADTAGRAQDPSTGSTWASRARRTMTAASSPTW